MNKEAFENIFGETLDKVSDGRLLLKVYESSGIPGDTGCRSRYTVWIQFFNSKYNQLLWMYDELVYSLTFAFKKNRIIRLQTQYEFAISLNFFEKLITAKPCIKINDPNVASQLIMVSLIYGRYASMQIRPFKEAVQFLGYPVMKQHVNNLFISLFARYNDGPRYLMNNLWLLTEVETDILMFVIQGNNIRNHPALPLPLSKKESAVFISELPENPGFADEIIIRGIIAAKILSKAQSADLLSRFFEGSLLFQKNPRLFYEDIAFWSHAYLFLFNQYKDDDELCSVEILINHFEYMRGASKTYTLKGKNIFTVHEEIRAILQLKREERKRNLINEVWRKGNVEDLFASRERINYYFREIVTAKELQQEGIDMKHCVYDLIENCINGRSKIFSLKKEENGIYKSYLTFEVQDNTLMQVSGYENTHPSIKDFLLIRDFCRYNNIHTR